MSFLEGLIPELTLALTVGAGVVAGIFYAFSTFVMQALGRVPSGCGMRAMQAINVTVLNPWFFGAFFGTGILSVLALVHAVRHWGEGGTLLLGAGAAVYLLGTIGVTIAANVPKNERLAKLSADDAEGTAYWSDYLSSWTYWNHVRTAASALAAVLFALALRG